MNKALCAGLSLLTFQACAVILDSAEFDVGGAIISTTFGDPTGNKYSLLTGLDQTSGSTTTLAYSRPALHLSCTLNMAQNRFKATGGIFLPSPKPLLVHDATPTNLSLIHI